MQGMMCWTSLTDIVYLGIIIMHCWSKTGYFEGADQFDFDLCRGHACFLRPLQCYIPDHKKARREGGNWLQVRQHWSLQHTFPIEGKVWSIMKAKLRAPGPDGIHNNLLKHLHEDTLKTLKNTKQDMNLCGFSWSVESSNSDPDP